MKPIIFSRVVSSLIVAIAISYLYTATGGFKSRFWPLEQYRTYYTELSEAFLDGHLYLGTLDTPIFKKTHGWDLSLYKGKYYLYFGVVPTLTAYLPIRILSFGKIKMTNAYSVFIFSFGVFLLELSLLLLFRKQFFPNSSPWIVFACIIVLAFANGVFWELRRPVMYQEAITSASFFLLLGIWASIRYLFYKKNKLLLLASAAFALAVGCRPTTIVPSILVVSFLFWKQKKKFDFTFLLSLGLPFFIGMLGLATYNYLRFDSFTEFGWHYQFTAVDTSIPAFSLKRFLPGLYFILFYPPSIFDSFPYLFIKGFPTVNFPLPTPYYLESPIGLLPYIPFVLITPFTLLFFKPVTKHTSPTLALSPLEFITLLAACGFSLVCLLSTFPTVINRFIYDYAPLLVLAAACTWIALDDYMKQHNHPWRKLSTVGISLLALWSLYANFFITAT